MSAAHNLSLPLKPGGDPQTGLKGRPGHERTDKRRRERRLIGLHGIGRRAEDARLDAQARLDEERRQVAAEVHDLVMQDIAFALARSRAIAADPDLAARYAAETVAASERALTGARSILDRLAGEGRVPLRSRFERDVLAAARDVPLALELDFEGEEPDGQTASALVHIGREAVNNAVKHARPHAIEVSLRRPDEWHLTIVDDGDGFDAARATPGFGLESMRRSAEALGGTVSLSSGQGRGTRIEVTLP